MSNAMRFGKRSLAGVAAGALALGMISFAGATSATAAPSVKPKADVTATVSPVRVTLTGTAVDNVAYAKLSWTTTNNLGLNDTVVLTVVDAPSTAARVALSTTANIGNSAAITYPGVTFANFLGTNTGFGLGAQMANTGVVPGYTVAANATAAVGIAANQAGSYSGTLEVFRGGNSLDVVSWGFTTTGAPNAMTLAPATQNVSVGGQATMLLTLTTSTGARTQPLLLDTVATTVAPTGAGSPSAVTTGGAAGDVATSLYDGQAAITFTPSAAGSYVVTATPAGTLPSGGVTAQSATVVASGAISVTPVTDIRVSAPANALNSTPASQLATRTAQVPSGTASVTVAVTAANTAPGSVVRLKATASAGTPAASLPDYVNVTLNASRQGTATFNLGGGAVAPGAVITVIQVQANNSDVQAATNQVAITQTASAVTYTDITTNPSGQIVKKVGESTPVTINVEDQFGVNQSGYVITAYRGSVSQANFVGTGTTAATGSTTITVAPLSTTVAGASETYIFTATAPGGTTPTGSAPSLIVNYTATGAVSTMSVAIQGAPAGVTTPITNATTSVPVILNGLVPTGGTASGAVTGAYTVATQANTIAAGGTVAEFRVTTSPQNTVTVSAPTGVFVSDTASTRWNAGLSTINIAGSGLESVYVFATKTGVHEITFTSGGVTVKVPVRFINAITDAYNIAVDPKTTKIEAGAFGAVTLSVTDVFGNPVPGVVAGATAAGSVAGLASGEVLLTGLTTTANYGTGADGKSTITLIAGKAGVGRVTFAPSGGTSNLATAWQAGYIPPAGAPAPVASAAIDVTITQDATRTIVITGERATVSGKPGIRVDGVADGFENGATVKPWIRFPGESAYNVGSARPVVTDEEFTWQRKTGKKVYVYFTSDDEAVKSNRVIIAAN